MKLSLRKAELLSLVALVLQLLFFLFCFLLGQRVNSLAVKIEAWHFLGGGLIWLILLIQFRQKRLAEEERLDAEQYQSLRREGKEKSVFEGTVAESALNLAGRRLEWIEKYLLIIFAFCISVYLLGGGYWLLRNTINAGTPVLAGKEILLESAAIMALFALISFLFSCYAVGMSRQSEWRSLRAGGNYLLSNALASFAVSIIMLVVNYSNYRCLPWERVLSYVLTILMIIIGVEVILNLILDAFSPRIQGRYRRAAFESRLLGLLSEPGGILRTAAHAIDYQFGFKVSETWFYRLLERAVVPLIVVQAIALYLLSTLAIVDTGHVGVLERWGKPINVDSPFQSGIHLKWPWPIDEVRTFPVEQIQSIDIGFERKEPMIVDGKKVPDLTPLLWTVEHWKKEYSFIVAVSDSESRIGKNSLPAETPEAEEISRTDFDLITMALVVHYRIVDVGQYGYGSDHCYLNPREFLTEICYRQTLHYCAQSDIEKLLGPGRRDSTATLKESIQKKVDEHKLGIQIVFVGMESVHPPIKVAQAFEDVISAQQEKQAYILKAQGVAAAIISQAMSEREVRIAEAQAYKIKRSRVAQAVGKQFEKQLQAYRKGGQIYLEREYLSVMEEMLANPKAIMRKYVIASDKTDSRVFEFDLKEKLQPTLYDAGIMEEEQETAK